jgi:glucose-6-phosphate dehydrogenase assembly protein OpcA
MAAALMIVDLPNTTTNDINAKIKSLREEGGAITLGRVLTLVIAPDSEDMVEDAIEAANWASREHPCRVIVVVPKDGGVAEARLDAQLRVGHDAGAGEVVVLRTSGPLAEHTSSVVLPFLLPDIPVVAWWPGVAPAVPAQDPLGRLAIRRLTDATDDPDPLASIKSRLEGYTAGDTDLAWSRVTYWRALLTSALDQPPFEPVESALVSGLQHEPALDILAGWLASRIDGPVRRETGPLKVELYRKTETVTLSRPQTGRTATLSRTAKPDALIPLARRDAPECLAEDLRRLDPDEIYLQALEGIDKVQYA